MCTSRPYPGSQPQLVPTPGSSHPLAPCPLTRRDFLGCLGAVAALGGAACLGPSQAQAEPDLVPGQPLPPGKPLRLKPILAYALPQKAERTSWRPYGGHLTRADIDQETQRINKELKTLASKAEFPAELLPLALAGNEPEIDAAAATSCDAFLVYGAGGPQSWLEKLAATKKPNILFVRHQSGPVYLWYEIAHWRLLRKSEDTLREPHLDVDDVVVDDYGDVLWRLRALYGLQNTRGTTMLAVGGLAAYSAPGQQLGPTHAKEVWGCEAKTLSHQELTERVRQARADLPLMQEVTRQAEQLLAQPNVKLQTDRKFVVNSFLAVKIFRDLLRETGATNLGVAQCMGSLIALLDTPPCLVLSLLNDEGWTAFCHTDFTHTLPGVLLRWISGKPSFVCNSHYPHHGLLTLAHCSAPRKMNGRDYEPTTVMTHFESDYGAATKVHYPKGQIVTCIVPNLRCTKWFAFRGKIADSPSMDMCRSQMDVAIDGDWQKLLRNMEGFHTVVCYGDYLREVGYAVEKTGAIQWENISPQT